LAEQQNGLRFDIYERVHLSEGTAGIKELENVELVPHIQVVSHEDQAMLRGNLLLTGTYVDEQDTENRTLEHLIPVEITLPLNRVQRIEDIAVEIENFDIDILSARSLNITGVLSLNGLEEVILAGKRNDWKEHEEEVVFVNNHSNYPLQERLPLPPIDPLAVPNEWNVDSQPEEELWLEDEDDLPESLQLQEEAMHADGALADEKKEVKIAFTGKEPEELKATRPVGLISLLNSSASVSSEQRAEQANTNAAAAPSSDRVEWKKLLLNSSHDRQEFRRLRLCIVQKEETLDIIAKRYELNPREIALFNRLPEQEVTEGQIVYIPR
jgi:stage VI sporulation protein D